MPLNWILKLAAALNANRRPGEIAAGIAFGLLLALQPGATFFRIGILLLTFFLKVNFPAVLLSLFVFSFGAPLLDGILGSLGAAILTAAPLKGLLTTLYNLPLFTLTRFNNSVVMGALAAGILLWIPVFFLAGLSVMLYRSKLRDRIADLPAVKWFLRLPLVSTLVKFVRKAIRLSDGIQEAAMALPKIFTKRYSEKDFRKKILRRIHVTKEKDFITGLFKQADDGSCGIESPAGLPKDVQDRLKKIEKDIKANHGLISLPKAIAALVLLLLIAGSYYFLRNSLLEKAMETALQSVFQARADVRDVDFDIFRAKISWSGLEAADKDKPMKNLFELGESVADIDMEELLRGRFVIEDLHVSGVKWNTDRQVSGALTPAEDAEKKEPGSGASGKIVDTGMAALSSFDVQALIEKELDKLASVKLLDTSKAEITELKNSWSSRSSAVRKDIEALGSEVKDLKAVNIKAIRSPEEAVRISDRINSVIPKVQQASRTAEGMKTEFEASLKSVNALSKEIEKAVAKDYAYVESLVSFSGGEAASLGAGLLTDFASKNLGVWYTYGKKALVIAQNISESRKETRAEKKPVSRRDTGRDYSFPQPAAGPKFLLRKAAFSAGDGPDSPQSAGTPSLTAGILNLTSDPDKLKKPAEFSFTHADGKRKIESEGTLDMRKEADIRLNMTLSAQNYPVKISLPAPLLGVKSIAGPLRLSSNLKFPRNGGLTGSAETQIASPSVEKETGGGEIEALVYSVLTSAASLDASVRFSFSPEGKPDMKLSSNLDKAVRDAFGSYVRDQEKRYRALARKELEKRLESLLAENETLRLGYTELQKAVGGNMTDASAYKKAMEEKKAEAEKRIAELKKQAADAVLKEAQKIAPEIPKGLPDSVPKSLPAPTAPKPKLPF